MRKRITPDVNTPLKPPPSRIKAEFLGQEISVFISDPELNILTYRYNPAWTQKRLVESPGAETTKINSVLDQINREMQKSQRAAGKTFVSRTSLAPMKYSGERITVFRVVLANPLTTDELLDEVLEEQCQIAMQGQIPTMLTEIMEIESD